MRKKILFILLFCFSIITVNAQLLINSAMTPAQLVQNVLVGGGVTVSTVTYTGEPTAIGAFSNGNTTNLGLSSGIFLCTGDPTQIPQSGAMGMSADLTMAGDADLEAISTTIGSAGTFDAAVLEFDFIPVNDTLRFRYVFGSEEYPEYVCSNFNDVFAFFVTGPNPSGGNYTNQNVALIPSTTMAVAINSVNGGSVGASGTAGGCTSLAYSSLYVDNQSGATIVFDGFTAVLTAQFRVTPCVNYHIKVAIADVGDGILDSGVFLEANSFGTNGVNVSSSYSNTTLGNNAIEGCSDGIFGFTLPAPATSPVTINYTIGGSALNGTDYTSIPSSVTIPVGSDSVGIVIHPLTDLLTEGNEIVTISVSNACTTQVYTLNIIDNIPLIPNATGTTTICPTNSATLNVSASGGITPYTYNWSNGAGTGTSATVSPTNTTTYVVTVSDYCSQTATDDVIITVANNLTVSVLPTNPFICQGGNVSLTASGAQNYSWSPGTGLSSTSGATVTASPTANTTYTVTGNSSGCSGSAQVTVNVGTSLNISVNPNTPSICPGGSVVLNANGGTTYSWSPATGLSSLTGSNVTANPTSTTTYIVNGTDASGCTGSTTVTVNVSPITASAITTDENCGHANGTATVTAGGNCSSSFSYLWNTSPTQQTSATATNLSSGNYTVTVTCGGCTITTTASVNNLPGPSVSIPTVINSTCGSPNGSATANVTGGNAPYSYQWNSSPVQYGQALTNVVAGSYNITVTDANQCTAMNTVTITNTPGPTAMITNIVIASCGQSDGTATAIPNGGTPGYSYNWNSSPPQSLATATNLAPGNYIVTVSDANSCTVTATVTIGQKPGPSATASSTNEICDRADGTATVIPSLGTGVYTYLWSATPPQTTATATNLAAGNYTVTVNDGFCNATATISVMNIPGPIAGFSLHPDVLTLLDGPVSFLDNSSGNIVNWQWNLGDGTTSGTTEFDHLYDDLGSYIVTLLVTDDNGCSDTVQDTIIVKEIFTVYIPNVFTPNGDGLNDFFLPKGLMIDPDNYEMSIFDRWGNIVFNTNNLNEGWSGTKDNSKSYDRVIMDSYVYRIRLKEILGTKHEYIGRIVLLP